MSNFLVGDYNIKELTIRNLSYNDESYECSLYAILLLNIGYFMYSVEILIVLNDKTR